MSADDVSLRGRGARRGQLQPATLRVVPPPQVSEALPDTVHAPLQVMLHEPAVQATFEPAPTVCVQLAPLH